MAFDVDNKKFLADVYNITEPGAAVRFLSRMAKECKSKAEFKEKLDETERILNSLESDIKADGKDLACFYDLTKQCLHKIPFFSGEINFGEHIIKWNLSEEDNLLMAQDLMVQDWYDEIKPVAMPERKDLPEGFILRLAGEGDVPKLRVLINLSYAELGEMGMNFVGVTQDEEITRDRMIGKEIWVIENIDTKELVATIALNVKETAEKSMFYISQFGVLPEMKRNGFGSYLIHHSFDRAKARGYNIIQLDTAIPAHHLVRLYRKFGFEIVEAEHRPRPNYPSYYMDADVDNYERLLGESVKK